MKSIPLHYSPDTHAVHAGEYINDTRGHVGPIYQTSTFIFSDAAEGRDLFANEKRGYIYSRLGNPTVELMERKVAALEGRGIMLKAKEKGEDIEVYCRAFASGMSAISSIVFTALSAGDHLLADTILYGCTNDLFDNLLPRFGIHVDFVDCSDLGALEKAFEEHPNTKMVFLETPGNPTMKLCDIAGVAELCKDRALLVVDNTFATPILQRPLELGADIVMHSGTKYLSGHGNVISGLAIGTDADFFDKMHSLQIDTGGVPSPFDSWLLNTGLKTLPLRMKRHCENAMKIADFLDNRKGISRVLYPACKSFPQRELAEKQMDGYGGVIAFEVEGGYERAQVVLNSTRLFCLAVSLGCVDSLIEHPFTMTHAVVPEEVKAMHNITPGMIRIAVGIEDAADLIDDLDRALG
jgi:methionine-gamma-lyase